MIVNENRAAVWILIRAIVSKGRRAERTVGGSRLAEGSSRTEHALRPDIGRCEAGQR